MRVYELCILLHPDLEMNPDPVISKVKSLIETSGGTITKEEPEGKKRTSYTIDGQDYAVYFYYTLELPTDAPSKIDSVLNITDGILRHMLVKEDPRKAKYEALRKLRAAESDDEAKEETKDNEEA
ncbi:30S ribosomal protein S6 [Candidatus Saccharibacteria bacterium]|nr:30S ribosomal protein S6 [Candidatus Saccharibacteria bacterium]